MNINFTLPGTGFQLAVKNWQVTSKITVRRNEQKNNKQKTQKKNGELKKPKKR